MGQMAGTPKLRGEVAYLIEAPPRRQMSTKFLRIAPSEYATTSRDQPETPNMSHDLRSIAALNQSG